MVVLRPRPCRLDHAMSLRQSYGPSVANGANCYGCNREFLSNEPRWQAAISDPRPDARSDSLDRERPNLRGWRWESVCTTCFWEKALGRSRGVRKPALLGEV